MVDGEIDLEGWGALVRGRGAEQAAEGVEAGAFEIAEQLVRGLGAETGKARFGVA